MEPGHELPRILQCPDGQKPGSLLSQAHLTMCSARLVVVVVVVVDLRTHD